MSQPTGVRTRPAVNENNAHFREGIAIGEPRIQQCSSCHLLVHPHRPAYATCGSLDLGFRVASGDGHVFNHVSVHRPLVPSFTEPYRIAVVELEEGAG